MKTGSFHGSNAGGDNKVRMTIRFALSIIHTPQTEVSSFQKEILAD